MMPLANVTWEFSHAGQIPFWLGLLIGVALLGLCLHILSREMPRLRRRKGRKWLYLTRTLVILATIWALLQPLMFIRKQGKEQGKLIVLLDDSLSMLLADNYSDISEQLDLAQQLKLTGIEQRSDLARRLSMLIQKQAEQISLDITSLNAIQDELEQGMPWGASFTDTFTKVADTTSASLNALMAIVSELDSLQEKLGKGLQQELLQDLTNQFLIVRKYVEATAQAENTLNTAKSDADAVEAARGALHTLTNLAGDAVANLTDLQNLEDRRLVSAGVKGLAESLKKLSADTRLSLAAKSLSASDLAKHHVETVLLSDPGHPVADLASITSKTPKSSTDLYTPFEELLEVYAADLLTGIVVLTDGQQNRPARPDVIESLIKQRISLITVGVGSRQTSGDIAIADYRAPGLVLAGKKATLSLSLKTELPAEIPFKVELTHGEKSLVAFEGTSTGQPTQTQVLEFELEDPGEAVLKLSVECARDTLPQNNSVYLSISSIKRRPKVLVLAPNARWDMAYMLKALEDLSFSTDLIFTNEKKEKPERGSGRGNVPDSLSGLGRYTLIVLDRTPFPGWRDEDVDLFSEYVTKEGGSLLLVGGSQSGGGKEWSEVFDGRFGEALNPGSALPDSFRLLQTVTTLRPHPSLPLLRLSALTGTNQILWSDLSQPRSTLSVPRQDIALLERGGIEIASLGFYGRGRVYLIGVDDWYRAREWTGDYAVETFFKNLFQDAARPWLAGEGKPSATLYPRALTPGGETWLIVHQPGGGKATAAMRQKKNQLLSLNLQPAVFAGSKANSTSIDGSAEKVRLSFNETGPVTFTIHAGGEEIKIETICTAPLSSETIYTNLSETTLKLLAERANGKYIPLARLAETLEALPVRERPTVSVREFKLWNTKYMLLLIATLMTIDWVVRRKVGIIF